MSISDVWKQAPSFSEEGIFKGVVTKVEFSPHSNVAHILFRKDGSPEFIPHLPENMSEELYQFLFHDDYILTGCYKCNVYHSSSRDIAMPDDEMCVSPYHFLVNLKDDSPVTIRTSFSWNGERLYVRYIKSEESGIYFGMPADLDWRQHTHPFPIFPFSGCFEINVLHIDPVVDDDDNRAYRVELNLSDDKLHHPYKAFIRISSAAGKKISVPIGATALNGKQITATFTHNSTTGRTTLDDFYIKDEKKSKKAARKNRPQNLYANDKRIAEMYPKLTRKDFEYTKGIYSATVVEIPGIDYDRAHDFIGFKLSDGRIVVPEIRPSRVKDFALIQKNDNLLYNRKAITYGKKVILYFTPARRGDYLMLRGIANSILHPNP